MAEKDRNDAADERQNEPRRGLEGKGFDAGTGYGGAGNSSAYSGESSYGGQSGLGGDTLRGAYAGQGYGRQGDDDAEQEDDAASGGSRRPGGGEGVVIPRGTDEHSGESGEGGGSRTAGGRDADPPGVDLDGPLGGARRDPGR